MPEKRTNLVTLVVMDGWGIAPPSAGNAIASSNPKNIYRFWSGYPHTLLEASGEAVGLPQGEAGNTETGHLNLGAGRIVYQDLPRINLSIATGSFFRNPAFIAASEHVRKYNSKLHLMGLVGNGGVHSNIEHLFALIRFAREQYLPQVFIHIFTDGRDSPPNLALQYIARLEEVIKREGAGVIASIMGRYWAMDRDFRWERTAKAYFALTSGQGKSVVSARQAVEQAYAQKITDEFIEPSIVVNDKGLPLATISDNDAIIFFNFRIDRPRQLTKAFVLQDFEERAQKEWDFDPYVVKYYQRHNVELPTRPVFQRGKPLANLLFVTMTQYEKNLPAYIAFPPEIIDLPIGRILSELNIRQLRMAESEKERFVGFYFNGQQESPFPGEDRLIIASPNVPTYDQKPEMSARELARALTSSLESSANTYGFVLINFANADMVGHTGNFEAAKKACSVIDECVGEIVSRIYALGGITVITADHGNAEEMIDGITGDKNTEHSKNPVPLIIVGKQFEGQSRTLSTGLLADVSPTILALLGIEKPMSMTGRNLLG